MRGLFAGLVLAAGAAAAFAFYSALLDPVQYLDGWGGYRSKNVVALICTTLGLMYFIVAKQFIVLWHQITQGAIYRGLYERAIFPAASLLTPLVGEIIHMNPVGMQAAAYFALVAAGICFADPGNLIRANLASVAVAEHGGNRLLMRHVPPRSFGDVLPFFVALHLFPALFRLF